MSPSLGKAWSEAPLAILLVGGTVLAMLSIGLYLTTSSNGAEPQSMPGYESIHGSVTFTVATLLLLAGLLAIVGASAMWQQRREAISA